GPAAPGPAPAAGPVAGSTGRWSDMAGQPTAAARRLQRSPRPSTSQVPASTTRSCPEPVAQTATGRPATDAVAKGSAGRSAGGSSPAHGNGGGSVAASGGATPPAVEAPSSVRARAASSSSTSP